MNVYNLKQKCTLFSVAHIPCGLSPHLSMWTYQARTCLVASGRLNQKWHTLLTVNTSSTPLSTFVLRDTISIYHFNIYFRFVRLYFHMLKSVQGSKGAPRNSLQHSHLHHVRRHLIPDSHCNIHTSRQLRQPNSDSLSPSTPPTNFCTQFHSSCVRCIVFAAWLRFNDPNLPKSPDSRLFRESHLSTLSSHMQDITVNLQI